MQKGRIWIIRSIWRIPNLEVMRARIRKLEVTVRAKTENEELRMIKLITMKPKRMTLGFSNLLRSPELITDMMKLAINAFETPLMKIELEVERVVSRLLMDNLSMKRNLNDVVDFLSVFMNNHGFKRIADKILAYLCEAKALEAKQKKAEIDRKVFEAEDRRKQEEDMKKKKDEERHELPPEPLKDKENYDIKDLKSDDDTDDEENPRKFIPKWAHGKFSNLDRYTSWITYFFIAGSQFRVALIQPTGCGLWT